MNKSSNTELPESHQEEVVPIRLFLTAAPPALDLERPKPSNQLESTKIYYDGGTQDFEIDLNQVRLVSTKSPPH